MPEAPKMDAPSIVLAKALDDIKVEEWDETLGPVGMTKLVLVCQSCQSSICDVDDGDTMRVLFNTALNHTCS